VREIWLVCWRLQDADKWQPASNQVDFREQDAKDRAAKMAGQLKPGCKMQHRAVRYATSELGKFEM